MSYENVVTKSRIVSSSLKVNAKSDLEVTISGGSDIEGQLCSGGMYIEKHHVSKLFHCNLTKTFNIFNRRSGSK